MEIIESGVTGGDLTKFERAVDLMEGVETIPAVAQQLVSLTSNPDAAFDEIEHLYGPLVSRRKNVRGRGFWFFLTPV
jgi:hypothetical protein